jgi:hypothetical protein
MKKLGMFFLSLPAAVLVAGLFGNDTRPDKLFSALNWSLLAIPAFTLTFALAGLAYGWVGGNRNNRSGERSRLVYPAWCEGASSLPVRRVHAQLRPSWRRFLHSRRLAFPSHIQGAQLAMIGFDGASRNGVPRSMKTSTVRSPRPYDAVAYRALQSVTLRRPATRSATLRWRPCLSILRSTRSATSGRGAGPARPRSATAAIASAARASGSGDRRRQTCAQDRLPRGRPRRSG